MRHALCCCLAWAVAIAPGTVSAGGPHIARESIEWCNIWIPDAKRVVARNKIAAEFVRREGIAVDDLCLLVRDHPEYWSADGVHFNRQGIEVEAEQVSKRILESLP